MASIFMTTSLSHEVSRSHCDNVIRALPYLKVKQGSEHVFTCGLTLAVGQRKVAGFSEKNQRRD
ncbi:unnamed protein product [Eruca vesicaria subsp. sativa]|uniref:Uncharacterized protein n=1 Tax=Eruca vesicaria subsp. sativa TaxID=29727 RepID=A0ABC8LPI8_ERUVS|nr:unnamed protein product [Eruca vesicaria subsp. sativa]